jgi:hypothetical protein
MSALPSTPPTLGVVIKNPTMRKSIYGGYAIAMTVFGATQVGFASVSAAQPGWLTVALAILAYLGIPVGGLALANTSSAPRETPKPGGAPVMPPSRG